MQTIGLQFVYLKCVDTSKTRRSEGRLQEVNERGATTYCNVYTHFVTKNQFTKDFFVLSLAL